ncbi:acetylornithine deacetylase (ArgE) [Thioclava sp. SK-1]|uniref:acetylornithine deacetylase n=1 Tax=Thioclava sp. SK-1 TaxID=1889770 RepID=UPI0008245030|nr:acetylornithine deacetylase [Thioclava sp. SK-1]OCX65958.1 acetylornithine deacetylase (ArgE) [Thioclava sp. SK-1]
MRDLEHATAILNDLIAFPTVSADSNLDVITYIAARLRDGGATVEVLYDPSGTKANLWATLGPDVPGGLVLSGHSDVVPVTDQDWSTDPFTMTQRDGALYGRGACDMKGFIACCLAKLPELARAAHSRPVHFAFTYDEEVGCLGGRALTAELKRRDTRPALCLIGEPTMMQVIEGNKGCCEYSVHFEGLEGHSSNPDKGVNAVEYAARYISRLLELRQALIARAPAQGRFDPPYTTLNIGALHGGVAHNVIANHARLDWEMRPINRADQDFVQSQITAYTATLQAQMKAVSATTGISTEVIGEVIGLEPMDQNAARDLIFQLTGHNAAGCVPFNTEAGLFQDMGLDVVICGPGDIAQAHKPDEFVTLDQMAQCLAMFDALAARGI